MSTAKVVTILHPSSAVNNIVNDASGNVAVGNNLTVAGTSTISGNVAVGNNLTVTGATTLTGGIAGDVTSTGTVAMASSFKRNRIINGNMAIAQRGTSFSTPANASYTLDRWSVTWTGAAPATVAQVTGPTGYQNALQITGAAGNTQTYISQRIESFNIADLASTTVTLSSTISVSTAQTIFWAAYYPNAVDNYASFTSIATGTWSATTTATRFSAQIALPSSAANGLWILFFPQNAGAFTSGTVTITGVQVEAGSVATPYERQIYSDQLAQCQRYYSTIKISYGGFYATATTITNFSAQFPVTMRTAPSISLSGGAYFNASGIGATNITNQNYDCYFTVGTTTTTGAFGWISANSAEL